MTKTFSMMIVALVCSASLTAAQAGKMDQKMVDAETVTVTGCVAGGAGAGSYTLTDATKASSMMDKDAAMKEKDKMAKDKATMAMEKDKMAADHTLSYSLTGGGDLQPHLGHKIEVTGTTAKTMANAKPMPAESGTMVMKPATLNVTSVKMLSATCP